MMIHQQQSKEGCCPWPCSLVVLKDNTEVFGPGLEIDVLKQVTHCGVWFSKRQWPQLLWPLSQHRAVAQHGAFPVSW